MEKNRFFQKIKNGLQEGVGQFVLYGDMQDNSSELYLTQMADGGGVKILPKELSLIEILKFDDIGLRFNKILYVDKENIVDYVAGNQKELSLVGMQRVLDTYEEPKQDAIAAPQESTPPPQNQQTTASLVDIFKEITDFLRNTDESVAIVISQLKWMCKLFATTPHENIELMLEIEKWNNITNNSNIKTFVLIDDLKQIQNYLPYFNEKAQLAIYLGGGPTVKEIADMIKFYSTEFGNMEMIVTEDVANKIATKLKNSKKNLLNSYNIVKDGIANEKSWEQLSCELGEDIIEVKWEEVFLNKNTKDAIMQLFEQFKNRTNKHKGILLYGPPGTGKTHIARALATNGGCYFYSIKLSDVKGEFVGESGKNLARIFNEARVSSPTILFFDEIDTIFASRNSRNSDSYNNDIVNQFLAESDGATATNRDIFIVTATNNYNMVDEAVKRRLLSIEIPLPDEEVRREMFEFGLNGFNCMRGKIDDLVQRSTNLSGDDIFKIIEELKTELRNVNC